MIQFLYEKAFVISCTRNDITNKQLDLTYYDSDSRSNQ